MAAGSGSQPLHIDSPWLWSDESEATEAGHAWPPLTTTITVCVAVDDITTSNGAEEIWPGSHRAVDAANIRAGVALPAALWEERQHSTPPERLCIPKGAVAFRDARLWHRGLPNYSSRPRPMIVMTYTSPSTPHAVIAGATRREGGYIAAALAAVDRRLIFCSDCKVAFSRPTQLVDRNARFVHGAVNHHRNIFGPGGAEVGEVSLAVDAAIDDWALSHHSSPGDYPLDVGEAIDIYSNRSVLFGAHHPSPPWIRAAQIACWRYYLQAGL